MSKNTEILYDPPQRGFIIRRRMAEERDTRFAADLGVEVHADAVAFGRSLYDRGFLTIPVRMRVRIRGIAPGVFEAYCRLPLADIDEVLDRRENELQSVLKDLGIEPVTA